MSPQIQKSIQEIRLRINCPATITMDKTYFLKNGGEFSRSALDAIYVNQDMLKSTADKMCQNSIYSVQNELKHGFLTLVGGHRAGVCGKTIVENGKIIHLSEISSINLRIAHEIKGAANKVIAYITEGGVSNTLIISPPSCGKTTLLRDIARQLASEEFMLRVGIVDERSEIAAVFKGEAQNDIGFLSDVYDGCPKAEGMLMLLRAMAPDVIITDEIGSEKDEMAIFSLINAGVRVICTAHGYDKEDLVRREGIGKLIKNNIFEKIIVLSRKNGAGTIERMY